MFFKNDNLNKTQLSPEQFFKTLFDDVIIYKLLKDEKIDFSDILKSGLQLRHRLINPIGTSNKADHKSV